MKSAALAMLSAIALSGCAAGVLGAPPEPNALTQPDAAGQQPISGIVGAGLLMSGLGDDLSRSEKIAALAAEYKALETGMAGEAVTWRDEKSGRAGTVIAAQPYRVGSQDCRPFTHMIEDNGQSRSVRGTACRNQDGSWTLLN
ncbi:RT0821/Lpp0805 family surface protein [Nitratireductor thuwali]